MPNLADHRGIAQVDASFVLDWLRQVDAPDAIISLQERLIAELGGYVGRTRRTTQIPERRDAPDPLDDPRWIAPKGRRDV